MADSFSPDIGMDIGASSVTPKAGPSADFGRVGRFIGSAFDKPKVSQESIDNAVLAKFGEDVAPFASLPPAQQAVRTIAKAREYSIAYPGLSAKFVTAASNITGVEDINAGTPFSIEQTIVNEFAKTPEFIANQAAYFAAAQDPNTGEPDQTKLNSLMLQGARKVAEKENQLKFIADEATRDKATIELNLYGDFNADDPKKSTTGLFATQIKNNSDFIALRTSSGILSRVVSNPLLLTPEAVGTEKAIVESAKAQARASLLAEIASIPGVNMSDARIEANLKASDAPFEAYLALINQGPEALKNYVATVEAGSKIITSQGLASEAQAKNYLSQQFVAAGGDARIAALPATQKFLFDKLSQDKDFLATTAAISFKAGTSAPTIILDSPSFAGMNFTDILNQGLTVNEDGTPKVEDPTSGFTTMERDKATAMPVESKVKDKEATYTLIAGWTPEISTPESFNVLAPIVTNTMLAAMGEPKPVPDADIKQMLTPNFANMANSALSNNQEIGTSFLKRTDEFYSDQVTKHSTVLQKNLGAFMMQTDAKYIGSVFSFSITNDVVSIKLNPQAKNEQAWLRDAIAKAGSEDPMKILGVLNAVPIVAAAGGKPVVNVKEVEDTIKSLNYILSIKNKFSPDAKKLMTATDIKLQDEFVKATAYQPMPKEAIAGAPAAIGAKVPEEYKAILPTLMQYYTLKDKFIAADTPEERSQIGASLKQLKDSMPGVQTLSEARDPSAVSSVNPWDLSLPRNVGKVINDLYKAQVSARLSSVPVAPLPEAAPAAPAPVPSETAPAPVAAPRRFKLNADGTLTEATR